MSNDGKNIKDNSIGHDLSRFYFIKIPLFHVGMPSGMGDCLASGECSFALRSQPQTREHHRLVPKIMFAQVFRCSTRKSYIFNRGRGDFRHCWELT